MELLTMPVEVRQAIDSDARVLRVLGAAGTGKSLVIEQRVLRLLRAGSPPGDIQVITAGRTAAQGLRARLAASGVKHATDVRVVTIRDLCRSLLGMPEVIEATGRFPRLMSSVEEIFLLEDIKGRMPGMKPGHLREGLEGLYRAWADLDLAEESRASVQASLSTDIHAVLNEGERSLQDLIGSELSIRQAMLVAELSAVAWRYLSGAGCGNDSLRAVHLLVDDFQNLSRASQTIVGLLFSESFTVTGNPCQVQSLSGLRPCPRGLMDLGVASVPPLTSETVVLKASLRCPQRVAAAGNALVLSMLDQDVASMSQAAPELLASFDESTPLGCVTAVKWADPVQECEEITSWLKRRSVNAKDPLELSGVLIIVPNRVWGRQFSKRLDALRLPHEDRYAPNVLRGNPLRLDASAGMRSLTLLTLAAHPDDVTAWRSWCGFGHWQANSAVWGRLIDWAREQELGISEALRHLAQGEDCGKASPFEGSGLLAEAWRRATAILDRCLDRRGERLLGALRDGNDPSLDDFEALVRPLDGTETAPELYKRACDQLFDPVFTEGRRLRIATFQTAATLEAKLVIITGMVEGLVPAISSRNIDHGGTAGEGVDASTHKRHQERCALYDTLSRATSELVFSYFQQADVSTAKKLGMEVRRLRPEHGNDWALLAPSSFLDEMGHAVPGVVARLPE